MAASSVSGRSPSWRLCDCVAVAAVPDESASTGARGERFAYGRALREKVPRGSHADWVPASDRVGVVEQLRASTADAIAELVPLRYERMLESPFAFLRGSAGVMASDLRSTPVSGLTVQACGDAHVSNFGEFATPERNIVFDVNDFDETSPGPWEWDVKRLAASLEVVMRGNGVPAGRRSRAVVAAAGAYRRRMAGYAEMRTLDLWYTRLDISEVISFFPPRYRPLVRRDVAKARSKSHLSALVKLTEVQGRRRRFIENPPVVVHLDNSGHDMDEVQGVIDGYRSSLSDERRELFDRFELVDVARKAVGVGSVGTRCWIALLEGRGHPLGDPLFLQVKEAQASVLESVSGPPASGHHGERVVTGQRLTQAASDVFLGWSQGPRSGRHYYVRQLWDVKGAGDPTRMEPTNLEHYGALVAWALARAHARTGDPVTLSAYMGRSDRFDRAVAEFAARYADQTDADHGTLTQAARDGHLNSDSSPVGC